MKYLIFIIFFYLLQSTYIYSQAFTIKWQKCLGGSGKDSATGIKKTLDNGYIIVGSTNSNDGDIDINNGGFDGLVIKLDSIGNVIWKKTVGGSANDYISSVEITRDSGILIAGSTFSTDGDFSDSHGLEDAWIIKLNKDGNLIWKKQIGGNKKDNITSISLLTNNTIVAFGNTSSNNSGDLIGLNWPVHTSSWNVTSPSYVCIWIIKLDSVGNVLSQLLYDGGNASSGHDYFNKSALSIYPTIDSGYFLATISNYFVSQMRQSTAGISKYSSTSKHQWYYKYLDITLNMSKNDKIGIVQSTDSNIYLNSGDNAQYRIGNNNTTNIRKLDNNGQLIWHKEFNGVREPERNYSKTVAIDLYNNNQLIAGSYSNFSTCINCDSTNILQTYVHDSTCTDFWIINLDTSGKFNWQKCYGGASNEFLAGLQTTNDLGVIAVGTSYSNDGDIIGNHGNGDIWIIKLNGNNSLPFKIKSFDLKDQQVNGIVVSWTVDSEVNLLKYIIQKSLNGRNFKNIAIVNANGNKEYSFLDKNVEANSYYRLQCINNDGAISYSETKMINSKEENEIKIYPNPSKNKIIINLNNETTYKINNILGETLQNGKLNSNKREISIENLATGSYFLILTSQNSVTTKQFIKN